MNTKSILQSAAALLTIALATPVAASAQDNPLSFHARYMFSGLKLWLVGSAEKMPEANYSFKPADSVRSFGEIIGHAADGNYRFCSMVLGEKNPGLNIEKTKSSKADLIAALKDALAYCDRAYDGMTDAAAAEKLPMGGGMPKLGVLTVNSLHNTLHYGNLITYMRMKDVVPPSSDPAFAPQPPKKQP
jgi:uncharacterized damage-inducible protein DinB